MERIMNARMMNWLVNTPAKFWIQDLREVGYNMHMELVPYWQNLVSRVPTKVLMDEGLVEMSTPVFQQWKKWQEEIHTILSLSTPKPHMHMFGHLQPILGAFPPPVRVASWAHRWDVPLTALTSLPMTPITWLATETRLHRLHTRRGLRHTDWAAQERSQRSSPSAISSKPRTYVTSR